MKKALLSLLVTTACFSISGCQTDSKPTNKPQYIAPQKAPDTEFTGKIDDLFLKQIKQHMDLLETSQIWPGYHYKKMPQYFIKVDKNNQPKTAFVINPASQIDGAQQLGKNENQGLTVLRMESNMHSANDKLSTSQGGNGIFDFEYSIDSHNYYLQRYKAQNVQITSAEYTPDVSLAVHEVFHMYQLNAFKEDPNFRQLTFDELDKFPHTAEMLTYQIALLELFKAYPTTEMTKEDAIIALKEYVAVVNAQLRQDRSKTTPALNSGWVYRHGFRQETVEGSAQYIDTMLAVSLLPAFKNQKFVWGDPLTMDSVASKNGLLNSRKDVLDFFAFSIFYQTGSSAIWLLEQAGYDVSLLEQSTHPYAAAKQLVSMTDEEMLTVLADLQRTPQWEQAAATAKRYAALP